MSIMPEDLRILRELRDITESRITSTNDPVSAYRLPCLDRIIVAVTETKRLRDERDAAVKRIVELRADLEMAEVSASTAHGIADRALKDVELWKSERDAAIARAEIAEAECDALRSDWALEQGLRSEADKARETAELRAERAEAECERLRALTEWRPIETAPCNDTFALVWDSLNGGHWAVVDLDHDSDPDWWRERGYTHWMPLPDAPK